MGRDEYGDDHLSAGVIETNLDFSFVLLYIRFHSLGIYKISQSFIYKISQSWQDFTVLPQSWHSLGIFWSFLSFLGPHLQHMEVPRLGVEPKL